MAKKHNIVLTKELLWELLHYDPETGFLYWKERKPEHFKHLDHNFADATCKAFNKNNAGKLAFHSVMTIGYRSGALYDQRFYTHRIIWFMHHGEWPDVVDHENGDKLDNRIENLRNGTQRDNCRNMAKKNTNKSGTSGVNIARNGKFNVKFHLGSFDTFEEALKIRQKAEEILGYGLLNEKE